MPEILHIEVVYALPKQQWLRQFDIAAPATVADALRESGILSKLSLGTDTDVAVGIFSRPVALDTQLRDGDRIEIYRPLAADPKDSRRQRVKRRRQDC